MNRLLVLSIIILSLVTYGTASATVQTPKTLSYPLIVPLLSESCQKEIKLNLPNNCPDLGKLIPLDNSIQAISGHFKKDANGHWYRENPEIKNHWEYYKYSKKPIVCIECQVPQGVDTVKIIIMQSDDFTFIDKYQNVTKDQVSIYNGRSLQGCDTATIANIPGLLKDTISFMEKGCIGTSTFQGNTTKILNHYTPIDATKVKSFQYHNVDLPKIQHLGNCITKICYTPNVYNTKKW